jgi:hypothetical protein
MLCALILITLTVEVASLNISHFLLPLLPLPKRKRDER